jgi:hypothetical protein
MSKRVKISFENLNKGNYTVISSDKIAEVNKRIKKEMTPIIREFKQKEFQSWMSARHKKIG